MHRLAIVACTGLALAACSDEPKREAGDAPAQAAPAASIVAPSAAPGVSGPLFLTPGLWETKAALDGETAPGKSRACVDLVVQKSHDMFQQVAPASAGCGQAERRPVAGGFDYTATCRQMGATSTVVGQVRGDARRVRIEATVTSQVEGASIPPVRFSVDSRWAGPCPAGMQPGDMVDDADARS
ncbi:DUF3617 family protein [Caulobacter sp. 17J65-9]|uniref:DUF3617 domain-containing protein n=1 Tax=Caulobacter sp. 17J65-9 TaxID=2709382 RepID=UPI0013C88D8F|nr:DUF3617 family protein [Caulobacter sp. 17J65-9]NEX93682.1 hypothetical protein [Caulobacter sp. 17J65-9]